MILNRFCRVPPPFVVRVLHCLIGGLRHHYLNCFSVLFFLSFFFFLSFPMFSILVECTLFHQDLARNNLYGL
jgi:hypothetical protein